ncbi:MAG TPA: hypothetical protein VGL70_06800 [Candidatus Binatia bacterium]|jgi:hypothetical protein
MGKKLSGFLFPALLFAWAGAAWAQPVTVSHTTEYVVKFVCGDSNLSSGTDSETAPVARGNFVTAINVHNPGTKDVALAKRVTVALPSQLPGGTSLFEAALIPAGQAFEIDCPDIRRIAGGITPPPASGITDYSDLNDATLLKGFVVILSGKIDVVTVYTVDRTVRNVAQNENVGGSSSIQVVPVVGRARKGTVQATPHP